MQRWHMRVRTVKNTFTATATATVTATANANATPTPTPTPTPTAATAMQQRLMRQPFLRAQCSTKSHV
jgi:hypothetical protein